VVDAVGGSTLGLAIGHVAPVAVSSTALTRALGGKVVLH
jgi:hypothetical protein